MKKKFEKGIDGKLLKVYTLDILETVTPENEMENEQIKAEAIKALESVSGFSYSEAKLDAAIARGICEGDILQTNGDWKVTVRGDMVIRVNSKGETQGPAMSLKDTAFADKCRIMLAITAARVGTTMGRIG